MEDKTKIKLVPLSVKRINDYFYWFNDKEVCRYLLPTTPKTKKKIKEWIIKTIKDKLCVYYSIFLIKEKKHLGHIGLKKINSIKKQAEIGVVIGEKKYWRKGIGTTAYFLLLRKIKKLGLKKIFARVNKNNIASINFFSKLGFKRLDKKDGDSLIFVFKITATYSHI